MGDMTGETSLNQDRASGYLLHRSGHSLDVRTLYTHMWDLATPTGEGKIRLFAPRHNKSESLKWLVEKLTGAKAYSKGASSPNRRLREDAQRVMHSMGLAVKVNPSSFRLVGGRPEEAFAVANQRTELDLDEWSEGQAVPPTSTAHLEELVEGRWSDWQSLEHAAMNGPTHPGVYAFRQGDSVVYVGMAGERSGKGIRGRLSFYAQGRALSGLGEAAMDRALADPDWVAQRLNTMRTTGAERTTQWMRLAIAYCDLTVAWRATNTAEEARELEAQILHAGDRSVIWNRRLPST